MKTEQSIGALLILVFVTGLGFAQTGAPAKFGEMPLKVTGTLICNFVTNLDNSQNDAIFARPLQR
jgi:hypothetical protein